MKTKTFLPFWGFYESRFGAELEAQLETEAYNLAQYNDVDESDICDLLHEHTNWQAAHLTIAKTYVQYVYDYVEDETGRSLTGLAFEELISPREYNFTTDRIKVSISTACVKNMRLEVLPDVLRDVIKERHTSRSGFHSFYTNNYNAWVSKPIEDWDEIEIETLLIAWLRGLFHNNDTPYNEPWQEPVFVEMCDDGVFGDAFADAVDWPALEEALTKLETSRS